jgi:hypothetical protein
MIDPLIDFPSTQYYFDTFVVGAHHSTPHLIADLQHRMGLLKFELSKQHAISVSNKLNKIQQMIQTKLDSLNLNELDELEDAEPYYWVNELGRRCAIEISTYGRIRPETMELLICLPDEDFVTAMSISGKLVNHIQLMGDGALNNTTTIPESMPRT